MVCPNKNTDEWRGLVSEMGEPAAMLSFIRAGNKLSPLKEAQDVLTQDYFRDKVKDFTSALGFTNEEFDNLRDITGYDAVSATDLINKVVMFGKDSGFKHVAKEAAYVAYSMLGRKNKIVTDFKHSITEIPNYEKRVSEYKQRSPQLNDFKIRELIVIDFLADAIKNNFEAPKTSYINRESEYWSIQGSSPLQKRINYILSKIMNFLKELFTNTKLSPEKLQDLADDLANDILTKNLSKFKTQLKPEQQLVNYQDSVAKDPRAEEIVKGMQKRGLILTGSLSLRRQGSIYRSADESIHDLDFTVQRNVIGDELQRDLADLDSNMEGASRAGRVALSDSFIRKLKSNYQKYKWFSEMKKEFPEFEITTAFAGNKDGDITISGTIGDYVVDFFVKGSSYDNVESPDDKGFQDWKHIFAAKIIMGRAKDMLDFSQFKPFTKDTKLAQMKSFRHFSFNPVTKSASVFSSIGLDDASRQEAFSKGQEMLKQGIKRVITSPSQEENADIAANVAGAQVVTHGLLSEWEIGKGDEKNLVNNPDEVPEDGEAFGDFLKRAIQARLELANLTDEGDAIMAGPNIMRLWKSYDDNGGWNKAAIKQYLSSKAEDGDFVLQRGDLDTVKRNVVEKLQSGMVDENLDKQGFTREQFLEAARNSNSINDLLDMDNKMCLI